MCGGRGKHSRQTPQELVSIGDRVGFDGAALAQASRLVAKVDNAAVQDGFDLYLHGFIVTDDGSWTVVQQGMNDERKQARRYHWLSEGLKSFVDDPHAAIDGQGQGTIVNLADRRAKASRQAQLELLTSLGPDQITRELVAIEAAAVTLSQLRPSNSCCPIWSCRLITMSAPAIDCATSAWQPGRGRGPRAEGFSRIAADSWRGSEDRPCIGDGGGSRTRSAVPLHGSGAVFIRTRRQGSSSVPGSAQSL